MATSRELQSWGAACLAVVILLLGAAGVTWAQVDIGRHPACFYCGMDRAKFAHSRVHIEYDDGSTAGTCSLHCAALDMALNMGKGPVAIQVGDYSDSSLIDAESASWVIGGQKPGVMTRRAKWAFAQRGAAQAFIRKHGGKLGDFEQALQAAYEDMYQDTKMIRHKRKERQTRKISQP